MAGERTPLPLDEAVKGAAKLHEDIINEIRERKLTVWNDNSYVFLTIVAAINGGNVKDTVDRYERVQGEAQSRGLSVWNEDGYVGLAFASLLLGKKQEE